MHVEGLLKTNPDSALAILKNRSKEFCRSDKSRAFYGLLLFQALDRNDKLLQPDSVIDFTISYFEKHNDPHSLSRSYYFKARSCKKRQSFDEATAYYLKSLELARNGIDYNLLGNVFFDMGEICSIQGEYNLAENKYLEAQEWFTKSINLYYVNLTTIYIGRIYRFRKDFEKAKQYYLRVLNQSNDSLIIGTVYQEIGVNFYRTKNLDSAQYYLQKSLLFPFKGSSFVIRSLNLADVCFDKDQYDLAYKYAYGALKHASSYYNQRDCYRILANVEYNRKNLKQMAKYMRLYQVYSDSVRNIENQSKSSIIESLHKKNGEVAETKHNRTLIISVTIILLLLVCYFLFRFYLRYRTRKRQVESLKTELIDKQVFVNQNVSRKIFEMREMQAESRKLASSEERLSLDKELYEKCLHLSNWDAFSCEMNHALNNTVEKLTKSSPAITQKEIIWCCLHLLDVPVQDRMLLLDASADSLYKLKQRLAKKLNFKSTKDLDSYLYELLEI